MKIAKAREYLSEDISNMDEERLRSHHVHLLDAWRESKAEYGMEQAVADGFYLPTPELRSETPADMWLTKNLSSRLDEVEQRLMELQRKDGGDSEKRK